MGMTDAGAAHVFTKSGSTWSHVQTLVPTGLAAGDRFAESVDLSDDGNVAILGSWHADSGAGAAYVFRRSGSTYGTDEKLMAMDRQPGDSFGYSVALSGDGTTALIGSVESDFAGASDAGATDGAAGD